MPTYEYECLKCKKSFDFFQSIKDKALTTCPKEACCMKKWGKGKIQRKLGAGAGFLFKGSGFYITDYRSTGYQSAAKKDKESSLSSPSPAPKTESAKPDTAKPKKKAD